MGFSRLLCSGLFAFALLAFKLTLGDLVCSIVGEWLAYYIVGRRLISQPHQDTLRSEQQLDVIICGFPRSGTMSLQQAMDILGFPCFHGVNLLKPSHSKLFMQLQKSGTLADWQELLEGYRSIVDFPAAWSYKQLMQLYPNAKIILNVRDPSRWYSSFSKTVMKNSHDIAMSKLIQSSSMQVCLKEILFEGLLKGKASYEDFAIATYKKHIEDVKEHVKPKQNLLVYTLEENLGWDPLCKFLEVDVPSVPFPSANDSQFFSNIVIRMTSVYTIVITSYLAFLLFMAFFYFG